MASQQLASGALATEGFGAWMGHGSLVVVVVGVINFALSVQAWFWAFCSWAATELCSWACDACRLVLEAFLMRTVC